MVNQVAGEAEEAAIVAVGKLEEEVELEGQLEEIVVVGHEEDQEGEFGENVMCS